MSITFEYSFHSELDLPQLVEAVNGALGTSLRAGDTDAFSCHFLGMTFVLAPNDAEDDMGIEFGAYRYQLWNKTWDGDALRSIQLEALVLAAFALHETLGISDAILTYEMQRLLARYSTIDGVWCDTTSKTAVDPLEHMAELQRRLNGFDS